MNLLPKVVYSTFSYISGEIRVIESGRRRRLVVGGLIQSVDQDHPHLEDKVWGQLINLPYKLKVTPTVLVLGLGGGTVVHLASKKLVPKKIWVVEIDPVVVDVAKKFFGLAKVNNLQIINGDAFEFLKRSDEDFYDLIIVDIYLGPIFPPIGLKKEFYYRLRERQAPRSVVVINRIFDDRQIEERDDFEKVLSQVFGKVIARKLKGPSPTKNYLYFTQKP